MARQARQADKEADAIMAALSRASDAAVETTLMGIAEKLRDNIPLMYHINGLLCNPEWTAVLENSIKGVAAVQCGEKPGNNKAMDFAHGCEEALSSGQAVGVFLFS